MQAFRNLARFLKPYRLWAILAPLFMTLEVAMDLMQPRLVQRIVDRGIAHSNMPLVLHTGVLMVCCALVGVIGGSMCGVFAVKAGQGLGCDLRRAAFTRVQALSFGNLDHLETGTLITRLTNDVTQIQDAYMMLLRIMIRVPLLLVGSLIMGALTSPKLAVTYVVLIPLVAVGLIAIVNKTFPMFKEVQHRLDTLNTVMQENLAGIRVVKAFARSAYEIARFGQTNDGLMDQNILAARFSAITMPLVMLALNVGVVAVVWLGGRQVAMGGLHIGQVIAFTNYLIQTLISLMMVSMLTIRFSRAEASAQRIQEVLHSEPSVKTQSDALVEFAAKGRVTFDDVTFSYDGDGSDPVLTNVSFEAEPGQTVAILGATGSGKSSLVNLIPRFYDVTRGRILIDGVDVRNIGEKALRTAVGVALQESVLFSGTIRDNIRYGRPTATEQEVVSAAEMAQAHDFIQSFPDGYDTIIGQRGANLSGGQKQRIAIARALLIHPAILVLDDSTSAVDVETEGRIQDAIIRQHAGQTCFIVAQRVSAVQGADRILVLDDGRVAGQGTHQDLMASCQVYREIYESQMDSGVLTADVVPQNNAKN
jgi:ATP-binding cassette subfamily B protein